MKNLLKMLKMVKGTYARILLIILSSVIFGALNAFWPIALRWVINNGSQFLAGKNQSEVLSFIGIFLIGALILAILLGIFDGLGMYLAQVTYTYVEIKITKKVYERSQLLTHNYFEVNSPGGILEKLRSGIDGFSQWIVSLSYNLIEPLVTIIYAVIIISLVSPISGILIIICSAYYILQFLKTRKKINPIFKNTRKLYEKLYDSLSESYSSFSTIRAMSAEAIFKKRVDERSDKIFNNEKKEMKIWMKSASERVSVTRFTLFSIIALLLFNLWQGKINTGDIVLVAIFVLQINGNLLFVSRFMANTTESNIKAGRIIDFLEKTPVISDSGKAKELKKLHSIEFKNVSFNYNLSSKAVISNISFKIDEGKSIALVGPSGVGKSTIAKLMLRFYEPSSGKILINGEDITNFTQNSLRRHMAIVMQDVALFNTTLKSNLLLANEKAKDFEIQRAIDTSNSGKFISELDKGINTLVGERGVKLSGGQKQRVAIARAILKDPDFIILDEATSALDSQSEKLVQEALNKLLYHKMSLIIAHRLSTVRHVDEIIVLKKGRICERGSHASLLREKGLYSELFNLQSKTGKVNL